MNAFKFAVLTLLVTCFFGSQAIAEPPYRGAGGQVEAAGMVFGTYLGTVQYIEACEKFPDVKARAIKSFREYLERNNQTYMAIMEKLPAIAAANGGDAEVKRLKTELEKGVAYIKERGQKDAAKNTLSAEQCNVILDQVDKGLLDLKIKHSVEIAKILK
jgi:hypothetical protein